MVNDATMSSDSGRSSESDSQITIMNYTEVDQGAVGGDADRAGENGSFAINRQGGNVMFFNNSLCRGPPYRPPR